MIDQTVYALTGITPIDEKTDEGLDVVNVQMSVWLFCKRNCNLSTVKIRSGLFALGHLLSNTGRCGSISRSS